MHAAMRCDIDLGCAHPADNIDEEKVDAFNEENEHGAESKPGKLDEGSKLEEESADEVDEENELDSDCAHPEDGNDEESNTGKFDKENKLGCYFQEAALRAGGRALQRAIF